MRSLPRPQLRQPRETTIGLVNIVFLMLIFFLVAGSLAPPLDRAIDISESHVDHPQAPPDALAVRADGSLWYRDTPITIEAYFSQVDIQRGEETVRLVADKQAPATRLIEIASQLRQSGANKVILITRRPGS